MTENCPVCGSVVATFTNLHSDEAEIECPKCGFLRIDKLLIATKVPNSLRVGLCIYLRRCYEEGRKPETLLSNGAQLENLADTYRYTTVARKLDYLLDLLAKRSRIAGHSGNFSTEVDAPAIAAVDGTEANYLVWSLQSQGLIDGAMKAPSKDGMDVIFSAGLRLSPLGWYAVQQTPDPTKSGRCFVAMSFDDEMNSIYDSAIKPAIESDAGFDAVMMRDVPHTEKICDRILAEIKRCQFVVADVTYHKQNVYFEAGFAMGLNRPVIWTCRQDHFEAAKFDTRQYFHIFWENPESLRTQLRDRILATIGHRAG